MNAIPALLIFDLIVQVIAIPISTLILVGSTRLFKPKDTSIKTALKVVLVLFVAAIIVDLVGFSLLTYYDSPVLFGLFTIILLLAYYALAFVLILIFYREDLKKTFLVWLLFSIADFFFGLILSLLIGLLIGMMGYSLGTGIY